MQRCVACERLVHPPALRCPHDHGELRYTALSGDGVVESWTVANHQFLPGFPPPYLIAFVTPVEDDRVRVLVNLVDVDPAEVSVGMPVVAVFDHRSADDDEVYVPQFTSRR